ncbi:Protein GES-1 [Aphelenchoides avenae]|nr:Protein GES-1 [Aphelenchus avenae]
MSYGFFSSIPLATIFVLEASLFQHCYADNRVFLSTKAGDLEGFTYELTDGQLADIFLGIPYASPPVGELRFEKPRLLDTWGGTLDATKFGPGCIPLVVEEGTSEDCLTLNIFRPHGANVKSTYPVLVYVHGGGYGMGGAEAYSYKNLSENFVSQGLIVVTIQYRLGVLGFATTGDDVLPGNFGMWDQATAFRWLYENIEDFGGRRDAITAWGLSAGSASVGHLVLSPHSRDYIARSIQMSGSALAEWAQSDRTVASTMELSTAMGCDTESSAAIKDCLKRTSVENIHQAIQATGIGRYEPNLLKYTPRLDGDFLDADVPELLRRAPKKPTLLGITEREALYFSILGKEKGSLNTIAIDTSRFESYNESDFTAFVRDVVAPKGAFGADAEKVQRELLDFYLHASKTADTSQALYLDKYDQLLSDIIFNVPVLWQAQQQADNGWPTYLYLNSFFNANQFPADIPLTGSTHANEYPYMNGLFPVGDFHFDDDDRRHQQFWIQAISSFAKTGKPSVREAGWPHVTKDHPLTYLHVDRKLQVKDDLMKDRAEFWSHLRKEYSFDIIRGLQKETRKHRDEL